MLMLNKWGVIETIWAMETIGMLENVEKYLVNVSNGKNLQMEHTGIICVVENALD